MKETNDENIEYGNEAHNVNESIVLEDINNNRDVKCGAKSECINQSSDSNSSNESLTPASDEIFVEKIASYLEKPIRTLTLTKLKTDNILQNLPRRNSDADGFIGVKRIRNKTKKFFLSGIDESVKEAQILSYLERRNIRPTYTFTYIYRRRGTIIIHTMI